MNGERQLSTPPRLSSVRVGDWIDVAARQAPESVCFVTDGEQRTYAQSQGRVHRLATVLADRGVGRADRIAILAADSPNYVETFLAAAKMGATAVPLNPRLTPRELESFLARSTPKVVFVSERYCAVVNEVAGRLGSHLRVVTHDTGDAEPFDALLSEVQDARFPDVDVADDEILGISFTSGTTGVPKGVLQSHRMFKTLATNAVSEFRVRRGELRYSAAPMFHIAGLGLIMGTILRGARTLVLPQFDPAATVGWLRSGVTGVFVVPTMISSILRVPDVAPGQFPELRTVFYGAAPMSPALLREAFEVFGDVDFINGFGAGTEAGMQTVLTPEDHRRAAAGDSHLLESIGRPGVAIDLRLVDDDMNDVALGAVGEIVTRSDMVMSGYLDDPVRTAEAVVDGWFCGGDLAWQDDEGYLYLAGRKSDMIIRGGENVYPIEVETVLADLPGVVECAVVGVPDEHWGEQVRAFLVVDADGLTLDVAAVAAFCRGRLAAYKVPSDLVVSTDPLPKNSSGKILKTELRTWTK